METKYHNKLSIYRFEFLLVALLCLLFDKMFFADVKFFATYIWSFNMVLLGIASVGIFKEQAEWVLLTKNTLFVATVLIALNFSFLTQYPYLVDIAFLIYAIYYVFIFIEVLKQIFKRNETDISVIFGSINGFLLLIVIAQFAFLILEYNVPKSFNGINSTYIPDIYNQLSYFSMVTLTTVGYGDISPATDTARLITMLLTIVGQFYMVALVGIIISRFTAKRN